MTEPRVVWLTRAQRRVVRVLARDGATNQQIADQLLISEDTVKTHMKAVLLASKLPTRTALVCALLRGHVVIRVEDNR